jgi:prepilin-type N-terminal cleavage/methylation domain-containing protein
MIRHAWFGFRRPTACNSGFSLVEVLLVLVIIAIAIIPLTDSITSSFQSATVSEENTVLVNYAREKMDDVLAMDFSTVAESVPSGTPTALSDTVTVSGETVNRDVLVELYDGDGDLTPDNTLKKISVKIRDFQLETLMANF